MAASKTLYITNDWFGVADTGQQFDHGMISKLFPNRLIINIKV